MNSFTKFSKVNIDLFTYKFESNLRLADKYHQCVYRFHEGEFVTRLTTQGGGEIMPTFKATPMEQGYHDMVKLLDQSTEGDVTRDILIDPCVLYYLK